MNYSAQGQDPRSLTTRYLRECDSDLVFRQIGTWVLASMTARHFMNLTDGLVFSFGPDSSSEIYKCIVKLNWTDLYEVEVGYMDRQTFAWFVVEQKSAVHNDSLAHVVQGMAKRSLDL